MEDRFAPAREDSVLSFLPWKTVFPFVQMNGAVATPIVKAGDHVSEGALIARAPAGSETGVNVHSSVPGTVVQEVSWNVSRAIHCAGLVVRMEGAFSFLGKETPGRPWTEYAPSDLWGIVDEAGVVEMEGAGRPLAVWKPPAGAGTRTLVIRCVFDDPWLVADYVLCRERMPALAEGALMAARMAGAANIAVVVAAPDWELGVEIRLALEHIIEEKKWSALNLFFVPVSARYPQRMAGELERSLRQFEKNLMEPLGEFVLWGPATICAIYDAVKFGLPPVVRYIAVGGSAVARPAVARVRIGSRFAQVFKECGGFTALPKRIAAGSPVMGRAVSSLDEPVTAYTYALFAVADEKRGPAVNPRVLELRERPAAGGATAGERRRPAGDAGQEKHSRYMSAKQCINCGACREVCPGGLNPERLYKQLRAGRPGEKTRALVRKCVGCGCCAAACPSSLPLSITIIAARQEEKQC